MHLSLLTLRFSVSEYAPCLFRVFSVDVSAWIHSVQYLQESSLLPIRDFKRLHCVFNFFVASIFLSWKVKQKREKKKQWILLAINMSEANGYQKSPSPPIWAYMRRSQDSLGWKIPPPGPSPCLEQEWPQYFLRLLRALCSCVLNKFKGQESKTLLGNLCQVFTSLTLWKVYSLYPARTILAAGWGIWLRSCMLHKTNILMKHLRGKGFFVIVQRQYLLIYMKSNILTAARNSHCALHHTPAAFSPQG